MSDNPGDMAAPLSRGDGRALEAGAEALSERAVAKGPYPGWRLDTTQAIIDSYLDALLSELPEEAVEAASAQLPSLLSAQPAITTFLLSLRSSSRGANR